MSAEVDRWAGAADRFVYDHYDSIRGQVRLHVIADHLHSYLPEPPAAIIDVGGGAGSQSIPLARAGYRVTIVDSSPAMLQRAATALREEDSDIARRVSLVEARGEDSVDLLGSGHYQGVLCHGVLPYVADPVPLVDSLVGLAAPGGVVSIVAKNRETLAVRPALERRWAAALAAFDATHDTNRLGFETRADTVDEMSRLLEERGVATVAWFGVRLFTDDWTGSELEPEDIDDLLVVEVEASRRDPYRRLSRLFHIMGRRD